MLRLCECSGIRFHLPLHTLLPVVAWAIAAWVFYCWEIY